MHTCMLEAETGGESATPLLANEGEEEQTSADGHSASVCLRSSLSALTLYVLSVWMCCSAPASDASDCLDTLLSAVCSTHIVS